MHALMLRQFTEIGHKFTSVLESDRVEDFLGKHKLSIDRLTALLRDQLLYPYQKVVTRLLQFEEHKAEMMEEFGRICLDLKPIWQDAQFQQFRSHWEEDFYMDFDAVVYLIKGGKPKLKFKL